VDTYPATARTTALRLRERLSYDAEAVHGVLDEALHCALAFVVDGEPRVLPTLHVRVGETLYVHGSTGSRPLLRARADGDGVPICVMVTLLDGLVLARSQFHHSANYRSVVAHGSARLVTADAEKRRVLAALVDKVAPGRSGDTRPPDDKELAQTAVLALPLWEVSVKARTGGAVDEPEDHALPHWAGVVPLRVLAGRALPEPEVTVPVPAYLRRAASAWHEPVPLSGRHVSLVPLDLSHVDGLLAATADDEVYRWLLSARPADRAAMAALVTAALDDPQRVPYAQLSTATGEVVGTTSYYAPDPVNRGIAIGYTMLGKPWWRTAFNTEAKLLLMTRAFDDLGAMRVEWHTDARNERSQRAIERLGAAREGVLRRHRLRPDGTWRDTVQYAMTADDWPAARDRLKARLAAR
jgi:RimJ/RimL family protein N-acetyltransferase/nitroimidazol reductase NimA-like FMN-containing flavoprotein (pyridoxamine 5'-phosphate oxidase superfamily)